MTDEFRVYVLPADDDPFEELLASVQFEDVTKGRRAAVLVKVDDSGAVPIVRTTTPYRSPAQRFGLIHDRLAHEVRRVASISCEFNSALVEHSTNEYATMKRHSDQALDLADESSIAIVSWYRDPRAPARRLVVKAKEPEGPAFDIPLHHGRVVAFDLDANRRFCHAIVRSAGASESDWLGITFRTSKTFVRFVDGNAHLSSGARLTVADSEQRRDFFHLKRRENDETSFTYPPVSYTLSESDLLPPS